MNRHVDMAPCLTRRYFLGLGLLIMTGLAATACSLELEEGNSSMRKETPLTATVAAAGRLAARPGYPREAGPLGRQKLGLDEASDALLYVPESYQPDRPAPLAVMLHGSGGNSEHGLSLLSNFADSQGMILLAPMSRAFTWDIIVDAYGPDIEFMDQALTQVFSRYTIDPTRLAIGGFSDGASYGLSVGLINGDLFSDIIAFSPGFVAPATQQGEPDIFISHGVHDTVLPIDRCSRRIVPALRRAGYEVEYHEFDGPHTIPPDIVQKAVDWFVRE